MLILDVYTRKTPQKPDEVFSRGRERFQRYDETVQATENTPGNEARVMDTATRKALEAPGGKWVTPLISPNGMVKSKTRKGANADVQNKTLVPELATSE